MSQKTYIPDQTEEKNWVLFDASGKVLGRLASRVAQVMRGKNKPEFTPHLDCGEAVVVINAGEVKLSGNKAKNKYLRSHSGYIGGLKEKNYEELLEE
ncbi:MAG: 50S ribosomal protein L13, partial [bacterium]